MMIQKIIDKVEDRAYYGDDLNFTGPVHIRWELIQANQITYYNLRCFYEKDNEKNKWYVYRANNDDPPELLMMSDPTNSNEYGKMKTCSTCNSYSILHPAH